MFFAKLIAVLGRLHVRLLVVNAVVLLVPVAGLEFARLFERQLLASLERDMRNQATLVGRFLEASDDVLGTQHESALSKSAKDTRTRIRILDAQGSVALDSHRDGPPEGIEAPPPRTFSSDASRGTSNGPRWHEVPNRIEVKTALAGKPGAYTRVREREPSVLLFITEPVMVDGEVLAVVYLTRSTRPVLVELYRIRTGLQKVLAVAILFTVGVTLWLAFSITRPLGRLSKVAMRIAKGETHLKIPVSGSGELRDLATALRTMTERLRKRMLDTSAFAADVAHAFKSPLTSIRGASELLAQGAFEDPAARERFLRNIELDAERLDQLVTRLLQLSRIEASTESVRPLELSTLLRDVADRSQTPDVAIDVKAKANVWVPGRKEDLATAFANLFDNAVKFSPEGSTVLVELEERGGDVKVLVQDEGPGVPKAIEERLFERFFTTDTEHGTGLGLSIVRSVVEAHGGKVTLNREAGRRGACFVVELRKAPAEGRQGRSATPSNDRGGTITK